MTFLKRTRILYRSSRMFPRMLLIWLNIISRTSWFLIKRGSIIFPCSFMEFSQISSKRWFRILSCLVGRRIVLCHWPSSCTQPGVRNRLEWVTMLPIVLTLILIIICNLSFFRGRPIQLLRSTITMPFDHVGLWTSLLAFQCVTEGSSVNMIKTA